MSRKNVCGVALALAMLVFVFAMPTLAAPAQPIDLDLLFIGAHPDDEAGGLSTYGQWNEYNGLRAGVITVTRGEGGGNAVGTEEGPALGLLREAEERRAVSRAGIANIYNLDKVDFYYTVSAPLTEQIWGAENTLEKVVRVVRSTKPDMIVTMNPSPTPGNHGHHQYAARLAIQAFYAAADPSRFPEQITQEGLSLWRVKKLFRFGAAGQAQLGPNCAATFTPAEATENIFGVFSGRPSTKFGKSWAQVEREAQREYVSQGWSVFPDVSIDPAQLGCDYFTLIDSRVPFTAGNTDVTAMFEGVFQPAAGGLPQGSEFYLRTDAFNIVPGKPFSVTAYATNVGQGALPDATVALQLPEGWTAAGDGALGVLPPNQERSATFVVTPAGNAAPNTRVRIAATLRSGELIGTTNRSVQVVPPVRGTLEPLSQVAQFRAWTQQNGVPQLDNLIAPVLSLGVGETRTIRVDLLNSGAQPLAGTVALQLPAGFAADAAEKAFDAIAPGATGAISFNVTNTDPTLKTSNEGGTEGAYPFTITTTSAGVSSVQRAGLNLVPVTTIPRAQAAPTVDGVESPGEYSAGSIDLSRRWEGEPPSSAADASGSAKITWADDALYMLVNVTDDTLGTVLPTNDAKRHWRTDSVEVVIDPRGQSENTSTTFKVGVFPTTNDPASGNAPFAYRDADAFQGPVAQTAPGMTVASKVSAPYAGYTLEIKIPLASLPAAVDPNRMGLNVFIYDSDTQNKTGQTRLGWSTYGGVQGDPYRWGHSTLAEYTPPADRPTTPAAPVIPTDATRSVNSPQSILQAANDGVALAGGVRATPNNTVRIAFNPTLNSNTVLVGLQSTGSGTANVYVWDGSRSVAQATATLTNGQVQFVALPVDPAVRDALANGGKLLVGFVAENGATESIAADIRVARQP